MKVTTLCMDFLLDPTSTTEKFWAMSVRSEKVTRSSVLQNLPNCSNCIMSIVKLVQIYPILHIETSCMHRLAVYKWALSVSLFSKCVMFVMSYSVLLLHSGVSFEVIAFVLFCFFVFHHMSYIFTPPLYCEWIPNSTGQILSWSLAVLLFLSQGDSGQLNSTGRRQCCSLNMNQKHNWTELL